MLGIIIIIIIAIIIYKIVRGVSDTLSDFFVAVVGGIAVLFSKHPFASFSIILFLITTGTGTFPIFLIIESICIFYFYKKHKREQAILEENKRKIEIWKEQGNTAEKDINILMRKIIDEFKVDYDDYFDYSNMPYGRAIAFINNFGLYNHDDEYFFFKPERSKNVSDIRENGILIAKSGIYMIIETIDSGKNVHTKKKYLKFENFYSFNEKNDDLLNVINPSNDGWNTFCYKEFEQGGKYPNIRELLFGIKDNLIPQILKYNGLSVDYLTLEEMDYNQNTIQNIIANAGVLSGNEARNSIYAEQRNYMNGRQGHGYAAEYGNITIDRMKMNKVVNEAQNLDPITGKQVKDGADRIVNDTYIQTKYYNNFDNLYRDTFGKGEVRYQKNGKIMEIEVPRDLYVEYTGKLQKHIDNGEIDGIMPGTKAETILRRGMFTYEQAFNIAKAGTIESLTVDALNGIITTSSGMAISSVISFAIAVWRGKSVKEAAQASLETGIQVLGKGMMIYSLTMQLTRSEIMLPFISKTVNNPVMDLTSELTKNIKASKFAKTDIGKQLGLQELSEKALVSNVITAAVVFGPDTFKFLRGRISPKQLFKNSVIGASGIGAGMAAGAFLGPIGSIAGGILGSMASKKILDKYIEDDAIEMFYIYKEEFLDIIMVSGLTESEFKQVSECTIGSDELSKFLEIMYSKEDSRGFAREYVQECVQQIYENKRGISIDMMEEGYRNLLKAQNV